MKSIVGGWEIVCPDGLVRHYPYTQLGDAEHDASFYAEHKCRGFYKKPSALELMHPPCPEGRHSVRPIVFVPQEAPMRGEA